MNVKNSQDFIDRLNTDMRAAMKARQSTETETLKSLLASIANAEAVPTSSHETDATEVTRRTLTLDDINSIINKEIEELQQTVETLDGASDYKTQLVHKIDILRKYK